jgi:hypothetical protein
MKGRSGAPSSFPAKCQIGGIDVQATDAEDEALTLRMFASRCFKYCGDPKLTDKEYSDLLVRAVAYQDQSDKIAKQLEEEIEGIAI